MNEEVKEEATKEETEATEVESTEAQAEQKAGEEVEEKPLDKMTAPELREIAKEIPGVSGVHAMKKAELLSAIKVFRGIEEEVPEAKKKKTAKPTLGTKELKLKMTQLRDERDQAREAKDKSKVKILRRRLNLLKKQTRKAAQG